MKYDQHHDEVEWVHAFSVSASLVHYKSYCFLMILCWVLWYGTGTYCSLQHFRNLKYYYSAVATRNYEKALLNQFWFSIDILIHLDHAQLLHPHLLQQLFCHVSVSSHISVYWSRYLSKPLLVMLICIYSTKKTTASNDSMVK